MTEFDRNQAMLALMLLAMAVFMAGQHPGAARWRRELRAGSIILFGLALALALIEIALWLGGGRR